MKIINQVKRRKKRRNIITKRKKKHQNNQIVEFVKIHMKDYLKGVVAASRNLSRGHNINKPSEKKAVLEQLDKEYVIENEGADTPATESNSEPREDNKPSVSINDSVKSIVTEKSLFLEDGSEIHITYLEKEEDGHEVGPFDYILDMYQEPQVCRSLSIKIIRFGEKRLMAKCVE